MHRFSRATLDNAREQTIFLINKIRMPERFKGTIVENWVRYWKNLLADYRDVAVDTLKDARNKPIKTTIYAVAAASTLTAIRRNPTENDYRSRVVEARDEVGIVAEVIRNPSSHKFVNDIETLFNENRIRRLSLGICSLFWVEDWSDNLGLMKAQCKYLRPALVSWHHRVIDIGFWGRFWLLEKEMEDFDVNPSEWEKGDNAETV